MGYTLNKPFTDIQRADFVCEHQGLNYYEDDNCIIMYLNSESVIDGVVTDISQTPEYIAEQRLKEIDQELIQAEQYYTSALDTPITYTNDKQYKPKWAEQTYVNLLTAGSIMPTLFPRKIWDATELEENAVEMTVQELTALTVFLANKSNELFDNKKNKINALLLEKAELEV